MKSLKRNNLLALFLVLMISGCTSSFYRIGNQTAGGLVEIETSPDRVVLECEFIDGYSGDYKNPRGFMIHILDDKKTVLTVSQGNVLDRDVCFDRYHAIEKILKLGHIIFIGGFGDISKTDKSIKSKYRFSKLGEYPASGKHLQYLTIWNDKGQCFDAYMGAEKPCPRDEFPLKEK